MVRLDVSIVSRNGYEKFTRLLVTELVKAVSAVLQQLCHDAVNRLQQRSEGSYLSIGVTFPVALLCVSGVAATRLR